MSDDARREIQLRRFVAAEFDMGWQEANLLQGETIEQLTASARALRQFLDERREPERPPDIVTAGLIAKAERRRAILEALSGRQQQRDALGRFLANNPDAAGSFDGGARTSASLEPESHEELLTRVLRSGEANAGTPYL